MRTVIYARFSSDNQNPLSTADQIALCRERADREGWPVVATFADEAISGAAGISAQQRPGLHAMLQLVESGGADQVLAEATDRLARHDADSSLIRERIEYAGAQLFTLHDGQVTPIVGFIKGFMDSQFRVALGKRVKRGQRTGAQRGRALGVAYGYRRIVAHDEAGEPIRGMREVDPDQAEIVRRIFTEYAAGMSPREIACRLQAEGVPRPGGSFWRTTTILGQARFQDGMLRNQVYVGRLVYGRKRTVRDPQTRTVRRKAAIEPTVETHVPELRIIDDDLWNAVQSRLAEAVGQRPERMRRPKHLLSGLGLCGVCGGSWTKISTRQWGCTAAHNARACTNGRTLSAALFDKRVLAGLKAQLIAPDVVKAYIVEYHREHARRAGELGRDREKIGRRHGEASRKVDRLVAAIADGAGTFPELKAALGKAREDRDAAAHELASLDATPVLMLHPGLEAEYRRQVEDLEQLLAQPETELDARPRVRAMIARIVVTPAAGPRGVELEIVRHLDEVLAVATGTNGVLLTHNR